MIKKFLIIVLLFIFTTSNSLGSPLVFKLTKEINTKDLIELGSFDAAKYRQIRIGIKFTSISEDPSDIRIAQLTLKRKLLIDELESLKTIYKANNPKVIEAQNKIDIINDEVKEFHIAESTSSVSILGVEGKDEIVLSNFTERNLNHSIIIDSPPSKISVKVSGKGIYSLYVWGQ